MTTQVIAQWSRTYVYPQKKSICQNKDYLFEKDAILSGTKNKLSKSGVVENTGCVIWMTDDY